MNREKVYLVDGYIIPSLKTHRFGKLLEWENEENGIFRVFWCHKSGRAWDENDFSVFTTWDAFNGRTVQDDDYYTKSKGRFRSALHRLKSEVTFLGTGYQKKYRRYQLKKYNVNNKNTTLKLKRRKQNRFSNNKMDSNQEVPNTLNIEIINKEVEYTTMFSEAENQLLFHEQSQLSPSGSSDSASIFNSENNCDSEYQQNEFDSNNNDEIFNLFDFNSFRVDSKTDLFQLHGDTVLTEEERTENKRNDLTEFQVNNKNTTLKLKRRKQSCFSNNKMDSNQEVPNTLNMEIINKEVEYTTMFSEAENQLLFHEQSQLSPSGSSDSASIFNSENNCDSEYQQNEFDSNSNDEMFNLFDFNSLGVDSKTDLFQLHGDTVLTEEERTENKGNDLTELQAMDFEQFFISEISSLDEFINGTQQMKLFETDYLENIST